MPERDPELVDLTRQPASRVQGAAFRALKDLGPGQRVLLVTAEEPSFLMRSLDLQLGHKLGWSITAEGARWRTLVRHRADTPPADVLDLLQREHRRLDALLARAVRLLDTRNAAAATPVLLQFTRGLTRHLYVEDEVLTPFFDAGAGSGEAARTMLREHSEIAAQLGLVEDCLRADTAETQEASAYCAILSGTLAKHEHREEQELFPRWRIALLQRGATEGAALLERVRSLLAE